MNGTCVAMAYGAPSQTSIAYHAMPYSPRNRRNNAGIQGDSTEFLAVDYGSVPC